MHCPACTTCLAAPCDTCLCQPHFAGMARWVQLGDGQIQCPVCRFTQTSQFWCETTAMLAMTETDNEPISTMEVHP